jgi:hypothetical protein
MAIGHFVERLWTDFIEPSNEDLFVRIKSRFKGWRKEAKQLHKKKVLAIYDVRYIRCGVFRCSGI